jgi:hypothetical protein
MPTTPAAPDLLRLLAADAQDLSVISAALQDAVLKVGDIRWEPKARRLTLELNRFRWEAGRKERVRSGLQLGDVLDVKARRIRREAKTAVLSLLAVRFEPGAEAPGGRVVFEFAGGADLSAEVECLEAVLADLTQAWPAKRTPDHDDQPVGN